MNRHSKNKLLVLNELVNANRLYQINEYMGKLVSSKNELYINESVTILE